MIGMIGMDATSLLFNVVFNLFFLILINLSLRKFLPNFTFSRTELLPFQKVESRRYMALDASVTS